MTTQDSLEGRLVRLETYVANLTGWASRMEEKLDEHLLHHRNDNRKNGNGYQNGNLVLIVPKRLVAWVPVIAGLVGGLVTGAIQLARALGVF